MKKNNHTSNLFKESKRLIESITHSIASLCSPLLCVFVFSFSFSVSSFADDYSDLLALNKLYQDAKSSAELRLWALKQTSPRVFIDIETAHNATDVGDFRKVFYKADVFQKLKLLDDYWWLLQ